MHLMGFFKWLQGKNRIEIWDNIKGIIDMINW